MQIFVVVRSFGSEVDRYRGAFASEEAAMAYIQEELKTQTEMDETDYQIIPDHVPGGGS